MAWRFSESRVIPQRVDETSTTQNLPLGTIVRAQDDNGRSGEFIYLQGIASTVAGSWVTYNQEGATALLVASAVGPVAVAMSANVASQYGWYQISGRAATQASSVAIASGAVLYSTASAGSIDDAVVSGDRIYNARQVAAKATTPAVVTTYAVEIMRPWVTSEDPTA